MGFKRRVLHDLAPELAFYEGVDWVEGPFTEGGETFLEVQAKKSEKIYRITMERVA